ncbi:hypothetical protein [Actinacidiphila oryziradicis]|uniref:Uncharacterized protein n=1 Tax=Actinacidiphila oryziradicis TaxID=2571141 RepID=A0A4U0S049_9ACTN|nr:hypothetical protein [Actinacidiphila oryziradicis]TKA01403.1 hypothetical protein FCI23_40765 [Actinacidiphila oryziradicis]
MGGRENSDEAYAVDLCDEVLREQGLRQHRFLDLYDRMAAAGLTLETPLADPGGFSSLTPPSGKGPRYSADPYLTPAVSLADASATTNPTLQED